MKWPWDCTERPWWAPEIEAVLAVGSLAAFVGATAAVLFLVVPAPNEKYAMLLLGALIGVVKDTFGRYFTVTKGGTEMRATVDKLASAAADTARVAERATPVAGTAVVTPAADVSVELKEEPDGTK